MNAPLIVQIVNKFGDHSHPEATANNLIFFEAPYVTACVKKALASGRLSNKGILEAKRWLDPERPLKKPKHKSCYYADATKRRRTSYQYIRNLVKENKHASTSAS